MLVDSHCHLSFKELGEYSENASNFVDLAAKNGVGAMLDIILSVNDLKAALKFSDQYDGTIFNAFGIHPLNVNKPENREITEQLLIQILSSSKQIVAVGETGLDYHLPDTNKIQQQNNFALHCDIATKLGLPIIIHTRDALADTHEILKEFVKGAGLTGVIHCFTEDISAARNFLDLGFYISFSGIVTFKNATKIQEAAKFVPLNKLLVETDSPYLAPVPFRGKTNQPSYVKYVAEYIALLRNIELAELANSTTNNFMQLFKIKQLNNLK